MDDNDFWIVKAKFRLKPTEEGGRMSGIKSGYRPNHVFEYKDGSMISAYMGEIKFDGQEWIEPGEGKFVTVQFTRGQEIERFLTIGRLWWIHEGNRLVGEAVIVEV
jgi:translation elongation factor EF-Tu-like GTPase